MKHYFKTFTSISCAILFTIVILQGQLKPFPISITIAFVFLWGFIIYNSYQLDRNLIKRQRIFKYKIGETTDIGKIKSRYYLESKNRNGGNMLGYYYVMENGDSFNEILINQGSSKEKTPELDNLIIGIGKPTGKQDEIDFYHEVYDELLNVAKKAKCEFPITKINYKLIESVFGEDDIIWAYSDSPLLQTYFPVLEFEPLTHGKFILSFPSGNLVVVSGDNLSIEKMGFIKP